MCLGKAGGGWVGALPPCQSVTLPANWEHIVVLSCTLCQLIEDLPAALWNHGPQVWLPGISDLSVQSSRFRQPRLTFPFWYWGQSSYWVKVLEAEGIWMCLSEFSNVLSQKFCCAAKENICMFSISTENLYSFIHSFIQESLLKVDKGWWWPSTTQSKSL